MGTFIRENNAGQLTFDNVLEESFQRTAIVTPVPIQTSAVYTDHRQQQQMVLNVQGLVTETPLEEFLPSAPPGLFNPQAAGFEIDALLGIDDGFLVGASSIGLRSRASLEFWKLAEPELLRYYSRRLGFVDNLFITGLSFSVTKAHHLIYDVECVQVEFSESERVDLPPLAARRATPAVCPQTRVGPRATNELDPSNARDLSFTQLLAENATGRTGEGAVEAFDDLLRKLTETR